MEILDVSQIYIRQVYGQDMRRAILETLDQIEIARNKR